MPSIVQTDEGRNEIHLLFRDDAIIARREWFAPNAYIEFSWDDTPVGITFVGYYEGPHAKAWTLTEHHVENYQLKEHLGDLRLFYQTFFRKPSYSVKRIENEDGVVYDRDSTG